MTQKPTASFYTYTPVLQDNIN